VASSPAPNKSAPPKTNPGYIAPQGVYTARAFCAAIGWCRRAYRQAKRRGLRVVKAGNKEYVRGADADAFFARLAEQQDRDEGESRKS
jgi:hypothetical protein